MSKPAPAFDPPPRESQVARLRVAGLIHDLKNRVQAAVQVEADDVGLASEQRFQALREALAASRQAADQAFAPGASAGPLIEAGRRLAEAAAEWALTAGVDAAHRAELERALGHFLATLEILEGRGGAREAAARVPLPDVLHHLTRVMSGLAQDAVQLEVEDGAQEVFVPPVLLERVLDNLVLNALQHGGARGVEVRLAVAAGTLRVQVEDRGPGISPAMLSSLFAPPGEERARSGPGWGLGLPALAQLVADHGGRISVDSAPGRGARFLVELPVDLAP